MEEDNQKLLIPYRQYEEVRDSVWRLILNMGIKELPVKISRVLSALGIGLYTYQDNSAMIALLGLADLTKTCDGFTVVQNQRYIIF